ncbi:AraD1 family protein [Eudoraea chungangensis]|uniref:AraD1 family protein n=1 Tax=Eudoraea chungangensis TaxID=1481905 RepID=UPI0023EB1F33|nr:AraD1 family protein [Eudoraea chungangensis]
MRLVQLSHRINGRCVALVEEPSLRLLDRYSSVYDLATKAIEDNGNITDLVQSCLSDRIISYDFVYQGESDYSLLPPFDCPGNPLKLMLAGTGLTHKASAENREKMHHAEAEKELTDSMKMYLMGVQEGHPKKGEIGVQPEWFYKGNGSVLRAHNALLEIPSYGEDGGEEPEVAAAYIVDNTGKPFRLGLMIANEFSDHIMERKNYLYLAPSKIRNCSVGPELSIDASFDSIDGKVSIYRKDSVFWTKNISTGEANMSHSLENLEYHHFKYKNHRLAGMAHIHFFGADAFSFGEGISLQQGDIMEVKWDGLGRPLRNTLNLNGEKEELISFGTFR